MARSFFHLLPEGVDGVGVGLGGVDDARALAYSARAFDSARKPSTYKIVTNGGNSGDRRGGEDSGVRLLP